MVTAAFGYWLAEPLLDRAVELESTREATEHVGMPAGGAMLAEASEPFSRHTQHVGFGISVLATAIALGVLFGVVHAIVRRKSDAQPWRSAVGLAGGAFFAVYLVPFVRYPAIRLALGTPAR